MRFEQQSIRDPLTGLYNRRFLNERFQEETDRARRYGSPFAVALLTPMVMDHPRAKIPVDEEDQLLRELSGLLTEQSRKVDVAARFGNSEFLVLLPETDMAGAELYVRKLLEAAEKREITIHGKSQPLVVLAAITPFSPEMDENYYAFMERLSAALEKATPQTPLILEELPPTNDGRSEDTSMPFR